MPAFRSGRVDEIISERRGLQRVLVDGERAYVLTELIGAVAVGDRVIMNTTAVDLGLGTGGWHVVHWNLERDEWSRAGAGHIMKLRYTSLQVDTGAAEEHTDFNEIDSLGGMPVVACALHSQVPAVAVAFKSSAPDARLVYVMTDGASLPLALSDLVHDLRAAALLDATVTSGHAFGGDVEAVNLHSALLIARGLLKADAVVAGIGPGIVGTGTVFGHTGLDVVDIVDAAAALGGTPVVAVRASEGDGRERHRGRSHHTETALRLAHSTPVVPDASAADVPDVAGLFKIHGLTVTTMGRGPEDDRTFFQQAGAAGTAAAALRASKGPLLP